MNPFNAVLSRQFHGKLLKITSEESVAKREGSILLLCYETSRDQSLRCAYVNRAKLQNFEVKFYDKKLEDNVFENSRRLHTHKSSYWRAADHCNTRS